MFQRGTTIGPYEVVEEIGRGGMGVVLKAHRQDLGKTFALKVLSASGPSGQEAVARFLRESRALAKIDRHPNIVTVYDVGHLGPEPGESEGPAGGSGLHYFAMECVEGGSLEALLDQESLAPRRAARIAAKVARALAHAHDNGIIHRDIKPGNVLLTPEGEPKITDFGLARDAASQTRVTTSGTAMGTPVYMSPEQAQGKTSEVGPLSDVYSVGAMLYELLTGLPPFDGESAAQVIFKVITRDPRRPRSVQPSLHPELEAICLKAMEKEPNRRYASSEALAEDLERWLEHRPVLARPPGLLSGAWKRVRRNRGISLAVAVAIAGVLAAGVFGVRSLMISAETAREETRRLEREREALRHLEEGQKHLEEADRFRFMHGVEPKAMKASLERALEAFTRAVESDPNNAQARHLRGRAYFLLGEFGKAESEFTACLQLHPDFQPALALRGQARINLALNLRGGRLHSGYTVDQEGNYKADLMQTVLPPDTEEARRKRKEAAADLESALRVSTDRKRTARLRAMTAFVTFDGKGGLEEALRLLDEAIEADPTDPDNFVDRATLMVLTNDPPTALAAAEKAAQIAPNHWKAQKVLAEALAITGEYEEALQASRRALLLRPDLPLLLRSHGEYLMALGRYEDAVAWFRDVRGRYPETLIPSLGTCLFILGEVDEAESIYRRALKENPDFFVNWGNLGGLFLVQGKLEEAVDYLDRALELFPDDVAFLTNRAVALSRLENFEDSQRDFDDVLALRPGHVPALQNYAVMLHRAGRYEEAFETNEKALAIAGETAGLLHNKGDILCKLGRPAEAVAAFDKALALKPENPHTWFGKGQALAMAGRMEEALPPLEESLRLEPGDALTLKWLGKVQYALHAFQEAYRYYSESLEANPDDAEVLYERGNMLAMSGNPRKALEDMDRLLALEPDSARALVTRAKILLELQRPDDCFRDLNRALALEPDHAEALAYRGQIHSGYGRLEEALEDFEAAIRAEKGEKKPMWLVGKADILLRTGRNAEALQASDRAIEMDAAFSWAWLRRGQALLALERFAEAIEALEKTQALEPRFAPSLKPLLQQARAARKGE